MNFTDNFIPKKTPKLIGYDAKFQFFKDLEFKKRMPKVLLLSGEKGIGKSTFVNHYMYFYFDNKNYDITNSALSLDSLFHDQYVKNLFPNICYLNCSSSKNVNIEDIRKLKKDLSKTTMLDKKRFIIIDDIDLLNINCSNALLKILEEPGKQDFFILINNKSKPLLETIKSRSLEIKFMINNEERNKIAHYIFDYFKQKIIFDKNLLKTSPGNLLKINWFFSEKKINPDDNFIKNISILLDFYKKEKNIFYKDLLLFYIEYKLQKEKSENFIDEEIFIKKRSFLFKNLNDFFVFNLNQNSFLSSLKMYI